MLEEIQIFLLFLLCLICSIISLIEALIKFANDNLLGIIFWFFVIYLLFIYRWLWKFKHNRKILKEYKRENNGNDKKYTAKFCREDCVFEDIGKIKSTEKIIDKGKSKNNEKTINKKGDEDSERVIDKGNDTEKIIETTTNNTKKIVDKNTGDNIYLVDEDKKCYYHIVDGYTFRKLGYPVPNKYEKGCFLKKDKELKKEIKIYNIISDINKIIKLKP